MLANIAFVPSAHAAFENNTPRGAFAGTHNYVITGGSLRAQSNSGDACALNSTSTAAVGGIPAGATIMAAYLYWGGSGEAGDWTVNFGPGGTSSSVTAAAGDRFSDHFGDDGFDFDFFGGFRDVTSIVAGKSGGPNGNYTFGGLTIARSGAYCTNQTAVAGWSLVVVYSHSSERYRYTRVYDGLQYFRGSSVTTTQSGFRVPDLVDGKVSVVTWEGDPDSNTSGPLAGKYEELRFDGNLLRNASCDASQNTYNSTIGTPTSCNRNAYGVDIDTYNVTPFLRPGQTGATLEYASGNDLVLLAAQVISTTNTPVADLGITKTHSGDFVAGSNGTFQIKVRNHGPEIATGTTTVTDVLPEGMSYISASGGGWSCSATGQAVTCTSSITTLAVDAELPALALTVAVAGSATGTLQNTATVTHPMFDGTGGNQSATDSVAIVRSDLSTSTKTVVDRNGGDADPGDVLRYTITLSETAAAAASGVRVTDDMPAGTTGLSVVGIPPGSTDASTAGGGANGTGFLDIKGISVPANGSVQVIFDVTVGGVEPGTLIDNTATVENPGGAGATPVAPTVTASQSQVAANGNKLLYLYDNGQVTRTPQAAANTNGRTIAGSASATWTLTPGLSLDLVLEPGQIGVDLYVRCTGNTWSCAFGGQSTVVELRRGATVIATSAGQNVTNTTFQLKTFALSLGSAHTVPAGAPLTLVVSNTGGGWGGAQPIAVAQFNGGSSRIGFRTSTVVNVDSVTLYATPWPGTGQKTAFAEGDTVYVRAVIGDPFGGADVSAAKLRLTGRAGTVLVADAPMQAKTTGAGGATRIFEGSYTIPPNPGIGTWTAGVTGIEGSELDGSGNPAVTHRRNESFPVHGVVTLAKAWSSGIPGDAVTLAISGGSSTQPGASSVGGASTTARATAPAGAVLTLVEAFAAGEGGRYSPVMACTRAKDGVAVPVTGTGFARTVTTPNDSAVNCILTNTQTVPLTVVKSAVTYSDPVNGTINPKAIPGALVTYLLIVVAPAQTSADKDSLVISDPIPPQTTMVVTDLPDQPGNTPVAFFAANSAMTFRFGGLADATDDVQFSNDNGASWNYVPTAGADGTDPAVTNLRLRPKGILGAGKQVWLGFRARIR